MARLTEILQPWQLRYFRAFQENDRLISTCSRQIGKSFIGAFCVLYDASLYGGSWTLVSTGQRAANDLFAKCAKMTRWYEANTRGTRLHFSWDHTASEIRLSNGAVITSVPNNPDGLRGKSSSLLFDEMAFISNASECWQACIPFLTSPYGAKKKLQVFSTPAGKSGKFYDLWTRSDYVKTRVTLEDAVRDGLKVDIPAIRRTLMDDQAFAAEYMCEFLDTDTALFPYDLLRSSTWDHPHIGGKVYMGVDIGRTKDRTSIAIVRDIGGTLYVERVEQLANKEFRDQYDIISGLIKTLDPVRVNVDATGIGAQLAEDLHRAHPQAREVKFSQDIKNTMFTLTRTRMGDGTLLIPDDNALIEDFHKIRRVVSLDGKLSFAASRDETGHADDATAVALAVLAARKTGNPFLPIAG